MGRARRSTRQWHRKCWKDVHSSTPQCGHSTPASLVAHQHSAEEKLKTVLNKLVDIKWQEDRECDEILRQFREVLGLLQRQFKVECESFSVDKDRLDSFFHSVIGLPQKPELKELWDLIKLLLTLSHGQAAVERGFSIKSGLLVPNLKTQSLVSQRVICDTIALSGLPVADFEITPGQLQSCSHAHARYTAYLEEQRKEKDKQRKCQKRAAEESELNNAKKKLKKLELTLESLNKDADKQALQAEQKSSFTLLAKSNALRQKAKQMEGDIKKQKDVVGKLSASAKCVDDFIIPTMTMLHIAHSHILFLIVNKEHRLLSRTSRRFLTVHVYATLITRNRLL